MGDEGMSNTDRYTPEEVVKALKQTAGGVYMAADILGCTAQTVYNYIDRFPECKEAKDHEDGKNTDLAKVGLRSHLLKKQEWAIKFQLTTKGGYSAKQEIEVTGSGGVIFLLPDNGRGDAVLPAMDDDE
jgi:hypothetical protein